MSDTSPTGDDRGKGLSDSSDGLGVDFKLLFAESPEVLLVLRPDSPRFTTVAATDARLRVTHLTRDSIGKGLFELFPDNPDDPGANGTNNLRASLERVLATRQADTMPVQKYDIRRADGTFESKYWSPKNIPVLTSKGEVLYILHRVEDVTDLVQASELSNEMRGRTTAMEREVINRSRELDTALRELRNSNLKLAELDAAKTVFFNNISHEFRTPLALILGTLEDELSQNSHPLPPQSRMQLKVAQRNSLRLLKLVNSLLDFSRIEAGRMQALYQPTDLAALTIELAGNFRSAIERGGLWFTVDCPTLTEPVYVDHSMWEKIVLNLLSNAFKHTFHGGIIVKLTLVGETVELRVKDSGIGIAPENLPRLFDRFHRVEGAASRTHEGTGIGLALVRELVQLHAADIKVESEVGRGSEFIVSLKTGTQHLPAERVVLDAESTSAGQIAAQFVQEALQWIPPEPQLEVTDLHQSEGDATAAVAKPPLPRARILWADDNADMRAYVTRLLGRHYDVIAVPDGQAALEAALASPPDLVLSDVMMPRLDGFGLLRALRADERTRRLPIILLSARAGEEAAVAGLDTGADDYLIKPFSARELLARVRTHVELAWQRRAWENELERRVKQRTAQLEAQMQRVQLLEEISRDITQARDLRGIFQSVIRRVETSLPADACWIGLPGPQIDHLGNHGEPLYEPDIPGGPTRLPQELSELQLRALVTVPMIADGAVLGVLLVGRLAPDSFGYGEREFLTHLGTRVAGAIQHGQLSESLQAAYDDLHLTQQSELQQQRAAAPASQSESAPIPQVGNPKASTK